VDTIGSYFRRGDLRAAYEYMQQLPEYEAWVHAIFELFEKEHYRTYEVEESLNSILLVYQQYYRDVFWLQEDKSVAEESFVKRFQSILGIAVAGEDSINILEDEVAKCFMEHGYHIQVGKTSGYLGPYIWKTTSPT
jgi:hypothetical protein